MNDAGHFSRDPREPLVTLYSRNHILYRTRAFTV
jgi:hypothetical protein